MYVVAASATAADSDGRGQSIMFGDQPGKDTEPLTTTPKEPTLGDRCMEMARKVEILKGKPQRRSAMMERYRQACESQ